MILKIAWIISKIYEPLYYSGQKVPSVEHDMFSGQAQEYVPIIWTKEVQEATRFDTKESAIEIAKLIARGQGQQVQVLKIQIQQRQTI